MKITNPKSLLMSKNSSGRALFLVIIILIATFHACKKEDSTSTAARQEEFATATAESDAEAETIFNDVFDNVMGVNDEVALGGTGVFSKTRSNIELGGISVDNTGSTDSTTCYVVSATQIGTTRFPLKIVIDFGTAGCIGRDGRTRKGKIIIVYTGRLVVPGNSATTTFDGYYINDVKVEGIHTVTNTSTQDKRSFTIQVKGAKLNKSNGNYTEWNSEKTIAQTEGLGTPFLALDDVFKLSGQASGTVKKGDRLYQWSTVITEPLTKKFTCRWIVKGSITLKKDNSLISVLDYGTGDCDNKASFTVNGVVHEITLH
jgi:hypothetical protein